MWPDCGRVSFLPATVSTHSELQDNCCVKYNISLTEGKEGGFPVGLWLTLHHTGSSLHLRDTEWSNSDSRKKPTTHWMMFGEWPRTRSRRMFLTSPPNNNSPAAQLFAYVSPCRRISPGCCGLSAPRPKARLWRSTARLINIQTHIKERIERCKNEENTTCMQTRDRDWRGCG